MEILIITGPPYSGKGTQCEILTKELGFEHISTGERCRLEKQNKTEIGKIMSEYEEKGDLVPDEIMKNLLSQVLDENIGKTGIILDGYPRTSSQVDDLLLIVKDKGLEISKVINIEVPKDELLSRAKKRAETSDRKDDKDVLIHLKRIDVFELYTRPAIDYMKSRVTVSTFNDLGEIADITGMIKSNLQDIQ